MSISQQIIDIEKNSSPEVNKLLFIEENFMAAVQEPGSDLDSLYLTVLNINQDNYRNYLNEKRIQKDCLSFSALLKVKNKYGSQSLNYESIWKLSPHVLSEVLLDNSTYINDNIWNDRTLIESINIKNKDFIIFLKYFHSKALRRAEEHFINVLEKEALSREDTKIILEALKEINSIAYKRAQVCDSVMSDTVDNFSKKINDYSKFILNHSTKLEIFRLLMRRREAEKMRLFSEKFHITKISDSRSYGSFTNELFSDSDNLKFIKENVTDKQFHTLTRDLYTLFVNELEVNNKEILSPLPEKYFYNLESYFNIDDSHSQRYALFMSKIISLKYQEGEVDNFLLEIAGTPALAKAQQFAFFDLLTHPNLPVEVIEKYVQDNPNFSSYMFNKDILDESLNLINSLFSEDVKYYGGDNISAMEVLLRYNVGSKFINYINKVDLQYVKEVVTKHTHKINFENLKQILLADKIDIVEGGEFVKFLLTHCMGSTNTVLSNTHLEDFIVQLYMRDEKLRGDPAFFDNLQHQLTDSTKEKLKVIMEHEKLQKDLDMSKKVSNNFKI